MQQLPPHEEISHPEIRKAAAALEAAVAAREQARSDQAEAEETLPQSEDADAALAAEARLAKKPEPKTRAHTAKHEARIRDLAHELKVREVIVERSQEAVYAALETHAAAWVEEGQAAIRAENQAWQEAVNALVASSERRSRLLAGFPHVRNNEPACVFKKRVVNGPEFRPGQEDVDARIYVSAVLGALGKIGVPGDELKVTLPTLARSRPASHEEIEARNEQAAQRRREGAEKDARFLAEQDAKFEERRRQKAAERAAGDAHFDAVAAQRQSPSVLDVFGS